MSSQERSVYPMSMQLNSCFISLKIWFNLPSSENHVDESINQTATVQWFYNVKIRTWISIYSYFVSAMLMLWKVNPSVFTFISFVIQFHFFLFPCFIFSSTKIVQFINISDVEKDMWPHNRKNSYTWEKEMNRKFLNQNEKRNVAFLGWWWLINRSICYWILITKA